MASKNPCLLCLGAFTLSPLLKYKGGRWISFPLFLELCWGFVAPEDVKQRGGDIPMTLWQICCTRAVAPRPLLKATLLHIWNWVSCLHFCEECLKYSYFPSKHFVFAPRPWGFHMQSSAPERELFTFLFPWWFSFQNQVSGEKENINICDMSEGNFPWGFPGPSFAPLRQQKLFNFCFFLNICEICNPSLSCKQLMNSHDPTPGNLLFWRLG